MTFSRECYPRSRSYLLILVIWIVSFLKKELDIVDWTLTGIIGTDPVISIGLRITQSLSARAVPLHILWSLYIKEVFPTLFATYSVTTHISHINGWKSINFSTSGYRVIVVTSSHKHTIKILLWNFVKYPSAVTAWIGARPLSIKDRIKILWTHPIGHIKFNVRLSFPLNCNTSKKASIDVCFYKEPHATH